MERRKFFPWFGGGLASLILPILPIAVLQSERRAEKKWFPSYWHIALDDLPRDAEGSVHIKLIDVAPLWLLAQKVGITDIFQSSESAKKFAQMIVDRVYPGALAVSVSRPADRDLVVVGVSRDDFPKSMPYYAYPREPFPKAKS